MPFSQADIDALKAAIATGTKRVQFENRSVDYQDTGEMLKALAVMESEVTALTSTPVRQIRVYANKGT